LFDSCIIHILNTGGLKFKKKIGATGLKEYLSVKLHKNQFIGSRIFQCGWTDRPRVRREEADSRFSQFCQRAKKM
jgi:hypothetical protein